MQFKPSSIATRLRQHPWLVASIATGLVGVITLLATHAATPVASIEPENGSSTAKVAQITDPTASGGKAVKFTNTSTFQANCIVTPSVCGYPDETNTGVPTGTVLSNSGSITVTQNGAVIQNLNVTGQIIIRANNVTIKNTRVTSGDYYPIDHNNGNTGLIIEDSEIIGTNSNVTASVSFDNYTLRRVNVHGGADGLKGNTNVVVEDSYIHDLSVGQDTHNDGFQATGGSGVTLRHNTFKLSTTPGTSACIQMGNEWGPNDNWLVTDNLIDGGGWSINASASGSNRVFTNNRFTRNAGYGPGSVPGSTWTGNFYDDNGAVVSP